MSHENGPEEGAHYVVVTGRGPARGGARASCSAGCEGFEADDRAAVNAWAAEHRSRPATLPSTETAPEEAQP